MGQEVMDRHRVKEDQVGSLLIARTLLLHLDLINHPFPVTIMRIAKELQEVHNQSMK
jgi:hypothetical protein